MTLAAVLCCALSGPEREVVLVAPPDCYVPRDEVYSSANSDLWNARRKHPHAELWLVVPFDRHCIEQLEDAARYWSRVRIVPVERLIFNRRREWLEGIE